MVWQFKLLTIKKLLNKGFKDIQSRSNTGCVLVERERKEGQAYQSFKLPHTTMLPATLPTFHHQPLYSSNILFPTIQAKKPWWCSGQHTRSGNLSPYVRLPKFLILSLSRIGRSLVRIQPMVLVFLLFLFLYIPWYYRSIRSIIKAKF